ncbi:MAG: Smr/MutS family protein, partial [Pseudomonadota bacterium]
MPRKLRPEEQELWNRVRQTAVPIHPNRLSPSTDVPVVPAPQKSAKDALKPAIAQFRIGANPQKSFAPALQKPAPVVMDAKTFGKMTRGKLAPEARIDLHGMTVSDARPYLTQFIYTSAQRQMRLVLVITGKGRPKQSFGPIPERA